MDDIQTTAVYPFPDQSERAGEDLANDARSAVDQRETAAKGVSNDARSLPEKGRTTGQSAA